MKHKIYFQALGLFSFQPLMKKVISCFQAFSGSTNFLLSGQHFRREASKKYIAKCNKYNF